MKTKRGLLDERGFSTNIQAHDPEVYIRPRMNQELDYIGSIRQNGSVKGSASWNKNMYCEYRYKEKLQSLLIVTKPDFSARLPDCYTDFFF